MNIYTTTKDDIDGQGYAYSFNKKKMFSQCGGQTDCLQINKFIQLILSFKYTPLENHISKADTICFLF